MLHSAGELCPVHLDSAFFSVFSYQFIDLIKRKTGIYLFKCFQQVYTLRYFN